VFKRRTPRSYVQIVGEAFYPRGGWTRAAWYVGYRLRRLPDPAHRISRGIFAGVFVSFTPLYGLHFLAAALIAWIIRGNILAALLATFVGNPITFPFIAAFSVEFGSWILGKPPVPLPKIFLSFSQASGEIWANFRALFTPAAAEWERLPSFFSEIFIPYLIGGIVPGIVAGLVAYWLANPIIASYQRGRIHKLKERFEKRRAAADAARERKIEAIARDLAEKADGRAERD
jgi:uncharacterized protein (DUF2062 family)